MPASDYNPFSRRESHNAQSIWAYRIATILSWLLVVIFTFFYTYHVPKENEHAWRHTIWGTNNAFGHSPFALNSVIVSIYWLVIFIAQIGYVWSLFSSNTDYVNAAAGVGSHFIFNNLLQFAWTMLFVRSYFVWSEIMLIINFFNLSSLYFRHNTYPRFIHVPAVTGPLAWTFVALYWNGAIAVNASSLAARILANVAIWGILVYGLFFLITYKDYTMGFNLSVLTAALGVGQFFTKAIAFQWIFAFTIMAVLFVATLGIAIPGVFGKEVSFGRDADNTDRERAPLLDDH